MHPSIRLEGSILSADILDAIERGERSHQSPRDFGLDPSAKVKDEIADAWAAARAYWAAYQVKISRLKDGATGTTETRNLWMVPLLGLLGYQLNLTESETIQGKTYRISHRDPARDQLPVHILGWHESLDRRSTVPNAPRMSPHGLVQEYLNLTEHLYGIVSNGRLIRLLRDSSRLVKLTFIEFDLERIFTEELFADFALFYRLLHASRLPVSQEAVAEAPMEIYHQDSLDSGSRIRDGLSTAVHRVILDLANGLLNHPTNNSLRELASGEQRVASGEDNGSPNHLPGRASGKDADSSNHSPGEAVHSPLATYHSPGSFASGLYSSLLRLIYRLLFLMVIEERGLAHVPGTDKRLREIYDLGYSLARLRRLSEKPHFADARHSDAWLALIALFRLVDESGRGLKLGVAPLGGDLFNRGSLGVLEDCSLDNATFLGALRQLTLFTNPVTRQLMRVNYGALNVEEFGSVYQGLLEFEPRVTEIDGKWHFAFAQGDERAATGSHYTEDELVQPLLKHSLDHLIEERLEGARRVASSEWRAVSEEDKNTIEQAIYGILSRPGSVAEGDGFGAIRLRLDEILSQRGIVRTDQPNPKSGSLSSGEHRRGLGTAQQQGLSAVSQSGQRQPQGAGNPSHPITKSGTGDRATHSSDAESDIHSGASNSSTPSGLGPQTNLTPQQPAELWLSLPLATRHSQLASLWSSSPLATRHSLLASLWSSSPLATRHSLLASQGLLALRVADISCGSGHILLAAARRIGMALAIVRTGDDQPSPAAYREAVRDVIKNCIYGVDLNPLAVELCKVALWLEAHVPGEPLGFLDHHIKCGNAIVGFVTRDELDKGIPDEAFKTLPGDDKDIAAAFRKANKAERKERASGQKQLPLAPELQEKLDAVLARMRELSALPEHTPAEIAAKKQRYAATQSQDAYLLRQIAAIPIAQFYQPKTAGNKANLITDATFRHYLAGRTPQGQATASAWVLAERKRAFHWFLEFPDIIANGGFDCILGNPPYLGGKKISGVYGDCVLNYLMDQFPGTGGLCDLVTYFVRRAGELTRQDGFISLITTNSISEGDTREGSLEHLVSNGASIIFAVRSAKWPGIAALEVALLCIRKGSVEGPRFLNGRQVSHISSRFDESQDVGDPIRLGENRAKSYVGTIVSGKGFLLSKKEAAEIMSRSQKCSNVVKPYIGGEDVVTNPGQDPSRYVIDFEGRSQNEADEYTECFQVVQERVYPERSKVKKQVYRDKWWQFAERQARLYDSIAGLEHVMVIPQTAKWLTVSVIPNGSVYAFGLAVITTERWDVLAVLQSNLHFEWARKYSSTLETRLRYTPSDVFDTFAFPAGQWQHPNPELAAIGERYHEHRRDLMLRLWLGLTDIYNLFHAPDLEARLAKLFKKRAASSEWRVAEKVPAEHLQTAGNLTLEEAIAGIEKLRALHVELDYTVLEAYGWASEATSEQRVASGKDDESSVHSPLATHHSPEIVLGHDFHEVETLPENDRTRYTITPQARKELLTRLLKLNHQRAAEEAAQAAQSPSAKGINPKKAQRAKKEDELL